LNLLLNAAHAIGDGNPAKDEIRVRTWADAENVFAEVQDTGGGVARQNLGRIFEPFFTTKPVGVGSGLGLSICRNIIAEFGGDIHVESELGAGARFVMRLPVRRGASEPPRTQMAAAQTPASVRGRILVVDDEPAIRSIVTRVLERDHEVVTAASGDAAREILENDPRFDVVICDLMMPGMTGMDLHEWLLTHRPALAERTVFISGGAFTERASEYVARVGNTRLDKPFDPATLKRVVSEMMSPSRP
jgi:CheY-like chemotaxis protein/anti-sigma regulatory factor (Ser/Thr protein kinase)